AAAFSRAQVASRGGATGTSGAAGASGAGRGNGSDDDEVDAAPPRGSRWRFALSVVGVLVLLAGIVGVSALLVRSNYFVTESDSQVVVKRGISGEVFGISLASVIQVGCLTREGDLTMHSPDAIPAGCDVFTLGDLREPARETVRAGMPSGSLAEAGAQVSRLTEDNLLPPCDPREQQERPREQTSSSSSPTESPSPTGSPAPTGSPSPGEPAPTDEPATPPSPTTPAPVPGETCRAVS
ncbi:serine/threonine protein phosphatase, partial [Dietzia sp. SLG510A3-30A2]|nr:serine/threonine protein phosphatase [Dietzia sp. SLG510A3-30A2]